MHLCACVWASNFTNNRVIIWVGRVKKHVVSLFTRHSTRSTDWPKVMSALGLAPEASSRGEIVPCRAPFERRVRLIQHNKA